MDKKMVNRMLENADRAQLMDLICKMANTGCDAQNVLVNWCKKNNKKQETMAMECQVENLWEEAREVISNFNEYGGGPEWEEERASNNLWEMEKIVREYHLPWESRKEIVDEMLEEFYVGNSGFDDILIDVARSFCGSDEEKRYFADNLAKEGGGYYQNLAAHIYKSLGDEKEFLRVKLDNLRYGSDYIEVARYFAKKGNHEKEMEYIWEGLKKSIGRLDELIDYAAPIYIEKKKDEELGRLYKAAVDSKWDLNIHAAAKHLYRYSQLKEDYELKKKMLLALLDTCQHDEVKKWFGACRDGLKKEDWEKEYKVILGKVKKKNLKFYLDICMETGREEEVLTVLHNRMYRGMDSNQYFSKRLAEKFPNEVLALYWEEVEGLIRVSDNGNYKTAAGLLKKIKAIMKKNGRMEEWEKKFCSLKEANKRKRNFMALVGKL